MARPFVGGHPRRGLAQTDMEHPGAPDEERLGALYDAPVRIGAAETRQDLIDALSYTIHALFPGLLRFEIFLVDDGGELSLFFSHGPARSPGAPYRPSPLQARLLTGAGPDALRSSASGELSRGSSMYAPLLDGRVPCGFIAVDAAEGDLFTSLDLQVLEGIAAVSSLAFQRLRDRKVDRVRASFELDRRSATRIQRRLMGQPLPAHARIKVDSRYLPALDVGGDFYELSCLEDGRVRAAIGDVSGKGVSAALIMSRVSSDVGRALRSGAPPSRILRDLNDGLSDIESDTFVTAACICVDPQRRFLGVASAGHLPLLVRRVTGEVVEFGAASGTPLGVIPCEYREDRVDLRPGDIVLLMTDGIADVLDCPGDRAPSHRLQSIVAAAPHDPAAINEAILDAASRITADQPRDDVTLVALQIDPG